MSSNRSFEFFPRDKEIRLQDVLFYLLVGGTFGWHQFHLGNLKRAYYLFFTCGLSHLLVVISMFVGSFLVAHLGERLFFIILLSGYFLGVPVLIWDFITLSTQVRAANGQANLL